MEEISVDIVVVGSGPSGQKAAIQAAKLKKRVLVVENEGLLGGSCLHSGTIPSKSLRAAILDLTDFYQRSFYSKTINFGDISINDLNFRVHYVIDAEKKLIEEQFQKNGIRVVYGQAYFENDHALGVKGGSGDQLYRVSFNQAIIASGSQPRNPTEIPFDQKCILDSSTLLRIDNIPQSLIVLGGGVIGSEYASFFAALGTQVLVVDKKDHMLPYLDREIGTRLQEGLSTLGLNFVGNKVIKAIVKSDQGVGIQCEDGSQFTANMLLYALGREAQVGALQIQNASLHLNQRGYIEVNDLFQTNQPHIFAVGDVIGGASLASTSMEQGRLAALNACGQNTHPFPKVYPLGIYTIPEISSCGMTEEQLKEKGISYEVGRAHYYEMAASHIYGATKMGLFKLLFHKETLELLGVHIIGRQASETVHIGQVAMLHQAKIDFFIDQIFNYPTFAEGYRIAALNGLNKIKQV